MMRSRTMLVTTVAALTLAACGGSDSSQDEVADLFIELADENGLELDEDCVRDNAARFSDDDAAAIVEAGVDGEPDISDEADQIGDDIFSCVDVDSYRDSVVDSLVDVDEAIDADCLREQLDGLETADEIDDALFDAAFECSTG